MDTDVTFEEIFEQNKRRIHYYIYKLRINDPYQKFYQEGLFAMWNAYKTLLNTRIIMLLFRTPFPETNLYGSNRIRKNDALILDLADMTVEESPSEIWGQMKALLMKSQWRWAYFYIILYILMK